VLPSVTFVNPLDIYAVSASLRRIAGNLEGLQTECAASRRIALDRYSWNSEALRLRRLFGHILDNAAGEKEQYFNTEPASGPATP
jgi:hypothetical protein